MKLKIRKNYSLIELSISIIVMPIILGLLSQLYIYNYKVSKFIKYNLDNVATLNQTIEQLNIDVSSSYNSLIEEKRLILFTNSGPIQYYIEEDKNALYRNDKFFTYLIDFNVKDITTEDNLYPLYEITFKSDTTDINKNYTPFELKTKITVPKRIN